MGSAIMLVPWLNRQGSFVHGSLATADVTRQGLVHSVVSVVVLTGLFV